MKIVNENKKTSIVLEDDDTLEVTTLNGNHTKITIRCLGGTLHLEEENVKVLEEQMEEEKAIKAMKDYLNTHKND